MAYLPPVITTQGFLVIVFSGNFSLLYTKNLLYSLQESGGRHGCFKACLLLFSCLHFGLKKTRVTHKFLSSTCFAKIHLVSTYMEFVFYAT